MSTLGLLAVLSAIAVIGTWAAAWPLSHLWNLTLAHLSPARSLRLARWNLLILAIPLVVGVLLALAAVGLTEHGFACHCAAGPAPHLCLLHPSSAAPLVPWALGLLLFWGGRVAWRWSRLVGELRALGRLRQSCVPSTDGGPILVDLGRRNAFTVGIRRPVIVADRGWWSALSARERVGVFAHEEAHVARRDPLALCVARGFAACLPPVADHLVGWWQASAEHAADRQAAKTLGDPLELAEFLLREMRPRAAPPGLAFHGTAATRRIAALATCESIGDEPVEGDLDRTTAGMMLGVAAAIAVSVFFGAELHGLVERLLNLLS